MSKRRLGRTDLSIAPIVFGGNVFGWTVDKRTSFDLLDRFAAAGLNVSTPPIPIRPGRRATTAASRRRSSANG